MGEEEIKINGCSVDEARRRMLEAFDNLVTSGGGSFTCRVREPDEDKLPSLDEIRLSAALDGKGAEVKSLLLIISNLRAGLEEVGERAERWEQTWRKADEAYQKVVKEKSDLSAFFVAVSIELAAINYKATKKEFAHLFRCISEAVQNYRDKQR